MADLSDSKLKLDWAEHHLNALNDSIRRFKQEKTHALRIVRDPNTRQCVVYAKRLRSIPKDWSLVVGDFAHNARSALNMLVYQLSNLGTADGARERLQFPIFDCLRDYQNCVDTWLKGVSKSHRTIIESFQPCNRSDSVCNDALGLLAKINNLDKHRFIPVVLAISKLDHAKFMGPATGVGRFGSNIVFGRVAVMKLEHGASFSSDAISLKFLGDGVISERETPVAELAFSPETKMDIQLEVIERVQFGVTGHRIDQRPVVDTLTFIRDRVKEVLGQNW